MSKFDFGIKKSMQQWFYVRETLDWDVRTLAPVITNKLDDSVISAVRELEQKGIVVVGAIKDFKVTKLEIETTKVLELEPKWDSVVKSMEHDSTIEALQSEWNTKGKLGEHAPNSNLYVRKHTWRKLIHTNIVPSYAPYFSIRKRKQGEAIVDYG